MTPAACITGLGRVGLPLAVLLAARGVAVAGCDADPDQLAAIQAGRAPFAEPGLQDALAAAVAARRLVAQAAPVPAAAQVIAVPTPVGADRRADLAAVWDAAAAIAPVLRAGDLVVLESTVPIGTTERLAERLAALRPDLGFPRRGAPPPPGCVHLAHAPERILPGAVLREAVENDRILGGITPACAARARDLYARFATGALHLADSRTAEAAKLAENAFRDVNIAFANELAAICRGAGIDPMAAIALANRHPRVDILRPGAGVGGHCIPVDPWFLAEAAGAEGAPLIRAARAVNDARPAEVAARLRAMAASLGDPPVACLGLAYKPEVDDLRNSPALAVVEALSRDGALEVLAADPFCARLPADLASRPRLGLVTAETALARAGLVALLVPHAAFEALRPALAGRPLLDATAGG